MLIVNIAQRLTELEAAHRLLKEHVNVHTLKEAVTDVLSNEKYKHGIRKLNDSFLGMWWFKRSYLQLLNLF